MTFDFYHFQGDDGEDGDEGEQGPRGPPGPPGNVAGNQSVSKCYRNFRYKSKFYLILLHIDIYFEFSCGFNYR